MTDTAKVLHEIAKLYAKPKKDQPLSDAVLELEEALSSRFDEYEKAFQGMYTANLIKAVDDFWRFKSDKVRPTLAQILAMHESDTSKKSNTEEENQNMRARILKCADELGDKYGKKARDTYLKIARQQWPNVDLSGHEWTAPVTPSADANAAGGYAEEYMQRDIKLNRCRHLCRFTSRLSAILPRTCWHRKFRPMSGTTWTLRNAVRQQCAKGCLTALTMCWSMFAAGGTAKTISLIALSRLM